MLNTPIRRFVCSLLTGFICSATFLRIGNRFLKWLPQQVIIGVSALLLLVGLCYAVYFSLQQKDNHRNAARLAKLEAIMRYGIALDLILLGLQKFFGLQFSMPLGLLDNPFSSISGEDLVFAFFGRSVLMVRAIGFFQIAGSVLLLFGRTKLTGVFLLLPVMLNIVLLNIGFNMAIGEMAHAAILLAGLLYFLLTHYHSLRRFFFQQVDNADALKNGATKKLVRLSAVAIPLLLIAFYHFPEKHPNLIGKYAVKRLWINQQLVAPPLAIADSTLTTVYFDQNEDCVFEYNNWQRRLIGNYKLNKQTQQLNVRWHYPASAVNDTLFARLINAPGSSHLLLLDGQMGNQFLKIELQKQ